jgi:alpha-beta hydrolase superfamily lysophospholipase
MRARFMTFVAALIPAFAAFAQTGSGVDVVLPRRIQFGATLSAVPDSLRVRAPAGALVLGVIPNSSAADAGVRVGDIITKLARDTVVDVPTALAALRPIVAGGRVPMSFVRAGSPQHATFDARERARETSDEFAIEYHAVTAPGGTRRVIVTHPRDQTKHPTVFLIGGIGCYSIDTPPAAGVNAYRDLMYHLTRRGYTTVRVEKLGVGDSEGDSCLAAGFDTELAGYRAALTALRRYPSVDSARVFLLGHSIGGIEAPMLAGEKRQSPAIRGIAVISTVGIAWYEYELANLRRQLELTHVAPDSVERAMAEKTACAFHFLIEREARSSLLGRDPLCAPYIAYPASDAYMQAVAEQNVVLAWKTVSAPALLLYGMSDFITSREEHIALTDAINAMHPGSATFADVPELDHYWSRQASQTASIGDPTPGLARPYYGATLEPILDAWLDRLARSA